MLTPQALGREALAHADALYRLARYLARDPVEAEELVQETFARALAGAAGLADRAQLRAWLFQILRNTHRDRRRRDARAPLDREADPEGAVEAAEAAWDQADPPQLRSLVAAEIDAALRALSPDGRTVILLDLEDLTETEIAAAMGCAVGTVKSRLARARAALRRSLAEHRR